MVKYEFTLDLNPPNVTHQSGTGYRARVLTYKPLRLKVESYKKTELKVVENNYNREIKKFAPAVKIDTPVKVRIDFFHHMKTYDGRKLNVVRWKTTKPDVDNMAKTLLDVIREYFLTDDNLVSNLVVTKRVTPDEGHIDIKIFEIGDDEA